MKHLEKIVVLFIVSVMLSCSKDDEAKVFPEENPLNPYLVEAGFDIAYPSLDGLGFFEIGFTFKPLVSGKINSVTLKIPDARDNLLVTIWDVATATIVFEDSFNVATADSEVTYSINPLLLVKDKNYLISMNTDSYYINSSNLFNPTPATYPITIGTIEIVDSRSRAGTNQVMPTETSTTSYSGNCSFNFQQTE